MALDTWASGLFGRDVIIFIDNNSALCGLVKGYSPKMDSVRLVGDFWLRAAKLSLAVYLDRVESKSNVADGPSRREFALMDLLGAKQVHPRTDLLTETPCRDPFQWFSSNVGRGNTP